MYGSKRNKKRWRKKAAKAPYWQDWMFPENKILRSKFKQIDDLPSGGHYRKIGGWFEWN